MVHDIRFKKTIKGYLSDGSFIRGKNDSFSFVFFCEHYPRRNVARRWFHLYSPKVHSSSYCSRCKLNQECFNYVKKINEAVMEAGIK